MKMKQLEYLIVGQGLSGSILAFHLLQNKKKFVLIDQGLEASSSKVAAGIINSLVLKRLTKSWRAEDFVDCMQDFYPLMEIFLKEKIYHPLALFKLLSSEEEEKYWIHRLQTEKLENFMSEQIEELSKPFLKFKKCGKVLRTAKLDVLSMLQNFRVQLKDTNRLVEEKFEYPLLAFNENRVTYKNYVAKSIIFCEGALATDNPFFNWLPFSLNKGELLLIKSAKLKLSSMLSKKIFVLPITDELYKIGASNEWKELDLLPTKEKREELKKLFESICTAEYEIVKQEAGIRPASRDRRPFIGRHPKWKNVYIFNGMGAKAALKAPLLSKELIDFIELAKPLHPECNINRYYKLYQINSSV